MIISDFVAFFSNLFGSFWGFLFTPLFSGISLGSIIIVFFVLGLLITFFFRGNS